MVLDYVDIAMNNVGVQVGEWWSIRLVLTSTVDINI